MAERWRVLALLFLIRTTMAFQFGSVGALGPLVGQEFQVDAAGVGFLIGLYLSPGLVIALPGGAIGRFFGDKRAVLAGLALMTLGGAISTFGATWEAQMPARVLAPETRALGMGLFFTLFYGFTVTAPLITGALLDSTGWDGAAMDFGAAMMLAAISMLAVFERVARRV